MRSEVKVKVINIKDGKLSLSMKALEDVAATEIEEEVFEMPETEEATTTLDILKRSASTTVIVECGFLTNPAEEAKLQ